jgi:hypothetical protein
MIFKPFKLIAVFLLFVITGCDWHNSFDQNEIKNIMKRRTCGNDPESY